MDTQLVGYEVLARLEKCAPRVGGSNVEVAEYILDILKDNSRSENEQTDMDINPFWALDLSEIWAQMPPTISSKQIGLTCRSMGLYLWRKNSGYFVAWNKEQLNILLEYFHMEGMIQ
jgi:hypothetical protein